MKKVIYTAIYFAPMLAFAQGTGQLGPLLTQIRSLLNQVVPVLLALAVIYFFWGLIQFLRGAGDPKAHELGKTHMIYGIIAIFLMVSVFGLVNYLTGTLNLSNSYPTPPQV